MENPIWSPSKKRLENSEMSRFRDFLEQDGISFQGPIDLHQWSVDHKELFWKKLIAFYHPRLTGDSTKVLSQDTFIPYSWFPQLKGNFAENLLLHPCANGHGHKVALHYIHESGHEVTYTYDQLCHEVARLVDYLRDKVSKGDVVAAYMPNMPETVMMMLATATLGCIFTSTSIDFGAEGVLDRFGQTRPKVLLASANYSYNGKIIDRSQEIAQIVEGLGDVHLLLTRISDSSLDRGTWWEDLPDSAGPLKFTQIKFQDPLYILYSSGTTGKPKCIVHSFGGTLLQHIKELGLHSDVRPGKKIFYFTTCGWMMWNWLVSSLFFGAEVYLYEGSLTYPDLNHVLDLIDKQKINIWGTSPKFLRVVQMLSTKERSFEHLETVLSTGAPLLPEQYDFIYEKIKSNVLLASISGGTDIIGCFMLGWPNLPVYRGEIQGPGLGMDIASFNEQALPVENVEGELVCRQTFPSCPLGFWNDPGNEKFQKAYFEKYPPNWHHGDFIRLSIDKTVRVFGRSDATLNPGGVRIGTAEIYRQVETLEFVDDSLVIGKQHRGDVAIILFVKMKNHKALEDAQIKQIKLTLKQNASPRHVPWKVFQVKEIPFTRSGKKMEVLITKLFNGREVGTLEALANPESLHEFQDIQATLA